MEHKRSIEIISWIVDHSRNGAAIMLLYEPIKKESINDVSVK